MSSHPDEQPSLAFIAFQIQAKQGMNILSGVTQAVPCEKTMYEAREFVARIPSCH